MTRTSTSFRWACAGLIFMLVYALSFVGGTVYMQRKDKREALKQAFAPADHYKLGLPIDVAIAFTFDAEGTPPRRAKVDKEAIMQTWVDRLSEEGDLRIRTCESFQNCEGLEPGDYAVIVQVLVTVSKSQVLGNLRSTVWYMRADFPKVGSVERLTDDRGAWAYETSALLSEVLVNQSRRAANIYATNLIKDAKRRVRDGNTANNNMEMH